MFVSLPQLGHMFPTFAIVKKLIERGHEVSYVTSPSYVELIRSIGATPLPVQEELTVVPSTLAENRVLDVSQWLVNRARKSVPQIRRHIDQLRPDAIVCDPFPWDGKIIAHLQAERTIQLHTHMASNDVFGMYIDLVNYDVSDPLFSEFIENAAALLRREEISSSPLAFLFASGQHNLCTLPRAFQYHSESFDDRFRFVGPCLDERTFDGKWQPPTDGQPLIFVSLGTWVKNPEFFRKALRALSGHGWNVLAVIADKADHSLMYPLHPDVKVATRVPQLQVLEHAALFVTHAGAGSTAEAMYYGVPMVAIPQSGEQQANAERLTELGLGQWLRPEELSEEALLATVKRVLADQAIRDNSARFQKIAREAGGTASAVEYIEQIANA